MLALETSNRPAVRAAYERFRLHLDANERTSFLGELGPLLDDRAAIRAMIRKVLEERRPLFEQARAIADAVDDPEAALASLRAWVGTPVNRDFRKYWEAWILPYSGVRTVPGFKAMLRDAGIADYWRKTGKWGDFCKPVAADDFQCR